MKLARTIVFTVVHPLVLGLGDSPKELLVECHVIPLGFWGFLLLNCLFLSWLFFCWGNGNLPSGRRDYISSSRQPESRNTLWDPGPISIEPTPYRCLQP